MKWDQSKLIWTWVKRQNSVLKTCLVCSKIALDLYKENLLKKEIWRYFKWTELLCIPNMSGLRMGCLESGWPIFSQFLVIFFSNLGRLFLALKKCNLTSLSFADSRFSMLGWYYGHCTKEKNIIHTVSDPMKCSLKYVCALCSDQVCSLFQ